MTLPRDEINILCTEYGWNSRQGPNSFGPNSVLGPLPQGSQQGPGEYLYPGPGGPNGPGGGGPASIEDDNTVAATNEGHGWGWGKGCVLLRF